MKIIKNPKAHLPLLISLLLLPTTSEAANWFQIAYVKNKSPGRHTSVEIDTTSVRESDGLVRYWVQTRVIIDASGDTEATFRQSYATDCGEYSQATTAMSLTFGKEMPASPTSIPRSDWKFAELSPDSNDYAIAETACAINEGARLPTGSKWENIRGVDSIAYIDAYSIRKTENIVTFWVKLEASGRKTLFIYWAVDCSTKFQGKVGFGTYDPNTEQNNIFHIERKSNYDMTPFSKVDAKTVALFDRACSNFMQKTR